LVSLASFEAMDILWIKSFLDCAAIASSTFAPMLVADLKICLEIINSFSFFN
jgi:hypothetical protein